MAHSGFQTILTVTNLNDFNGLPQTWHCGIKGTGGCFADVAAVTQSTCSAQCVGSRYDGIVDC
jgi:hypothetical protein